MRPIIIFLLAVLCYTNLNAQQTRAFTDKRDGKTYKTTQIGKQTWMAENLNYAMQDSWCYAYDTANCKKYGRLYIWEAARYACPSDWHLPSSEELQQLEIFWGSKPKDAKKSGKRDSQIGQKLRNSDGFNALPAGYRMDYNYSFEGIGEYAYWWTNSSAETIEVSDTQTWVWYINFENNKTYIRNRDRKDAYSVRCIKDSQN